MSRHIALVVRWPTGGIRTYLKYVYPAILQAGWRATIIGPPDDEMEVLKQDLSAFGVGYAWQPHHNMFIAIAATLRRLARDSTVDLVHSHGLTSALASVGYTRLSGLPHMATLHDVFNEAQFRGGKGVLKRQLIAMGLTQVDIVQAVSKDALENLLQYLPLLRWAARDSVIDIPNGIQSAGFASAAPRDLRSECGVPEAALLVGFLGRFMGQKGFRYLIDAVRLIKEHKLLDPVPVVVGVGGGGFIREDRAFIRDLDMESQFRFLPFVPNVASTIKGCDVVAMPSLWEASGILAMETLAAGVPLIGTSCIGLKETLSRTPADIVEPRSADRLAKAMVRLSGDLENRRFVAQGFAEEAQRRFDVRHTSSKVLAQIEGLCPTN